MRLFDKDASSDDFLGEATLLLREFMSHVKCMCCALSLSCRACQVIYSLLPSAHGPYLSLYLVAVPYMFARAFRDCHASLKLLWSVLLVLH